MREEIAAKPVSDEPVDQDWHVAQVGAPPTARFHAIHVYFSASLPAAGLANNWLYFSVSDGTHSISPIWNDGDCNRKDIVCGRKMAQNRPIALKSTSRR